MARLTRDELGLVIEPQVRRLCGPIFFTRSLEQAFGNVTNNGSFGLVDTGKRKLLVTCHHVLAGFHGLRLMNPELKMCVCFDWKTPIVFDADKPIDTDQTIDLATFDMEPFLSACGGHDFFNVQRNPPPKVKKGDVLFFIGFPGHLRRVVDGALGFGRSPYAVVAAGADDLHFYSDISNVQRPDDDVGGISGCPCFSVRGGKPIQLVGFATSHWMNHLFFTYASRIDSDGRIIR